MADQLSQAQVNEVYSALEDTLDTFFIEDITYRERQKVFSRHREGDDYQSVDHALKGRSVLPSNEKEERESSAAVNYDIAFHFSYKNLQENGYLNSEGQPVFDPGKDYFVYAGELYEQIGRAHFEDSVFKDRPVVVVVQCRKHEPNA